MPSRVLRVHGFFHLKFWKVLLFPFYREGSRFTKSLDNLFSITSLRHSIFSTYILKYLVINSLSFYSSEDVSLSCLALTYYKPAIEIWQLFSSKDMFVLIPNHCLWWDFDTNLLSFFTGMHHVLFPFAALKIVHLNLQQFDLMYFCCFFVFILLGVCWAS